MANRIGKKATVQMNVRMDVDLAEAVEEEARLLESAQTKIVRASLRTWLTMPMARRRQLIAELEGVRG